MKTAEKYITQIFLVNYFALKQEVVQRAVELAEQQLKSQIEVSDQSQLHKGFVQQISNT